MMKLTALPCLCVDVFDGTDEIRPGGEALNFAVHASGFEGINVTILGVIGNDEYGRAILQSVKDKRIEKKYIRTDSNYVTANNRTYLTPEGDRYYKEDSWNGKILDHYKITEKEAEVIAASDVVFVHFWASCFEDVVELKKRYPFKLAVDFDVYRDFEHMEKYAPYIDFFMISGAEDLLHHFEAFSQKYEGLFNMSLGEKGSVTYFKGTEYRVDAEKVEEVVDTTGCGDSYHAGFVCDYLLCGDIKEAMHTGAKIAAKTLGHYGGF